VNYVANLAEAQETALIVCRKGRRAINAKADVSKRADIEAIFERAWQRLGRGGRQYGSPPPINFNGGVAPMRFRWGVNPK
jgi:NAD(P)-dependent dehydrogenase (short-subunit alcohol dehydrogenase family)